MQKLFRSLLLAVLTAGVSSTANAGELTVTMANGRVTVIAKEVPLRQILAEWARVGNTRMVNADKVVGGPLTLQLVDVSEKEALDILLRSAAGYVTASREIPETGVSVYDRVIILATSRPPAGGVTAPPTPFNNRQAIQQPLAPQPPPPDPIDDDGEPADQGPNAQPGLQNPGMPFPGPGVNNPNAQPMNPNATPQNVPTVAPRPGMLPQPQPGVVNPYAPQPLVPNGRPVNPNGRGGPGVPDPDDR